MIKEADLSTLGKRLGHVANLAGGQAELARAADTSQPTISRIIQGRETTLSVMLRVFDVLKPHGVKLDWLLLGEGEDPVTRPSDHILFLKIYGEESLNKTAPITFNDNWFNTHVSRNPENCIAFESQEDDYKNIKKGSWTVIDQTKKNGDGLFLTKISQSIYIRKIQFLPTGELKVASFSDAFEDFTLSSSQKDLIQIIGKVVWWETH